MAQEQTRNGERLKTGDRAPESGVYRMVGHVDGSNCESTPEEMQIPLAKGETFPPDRHCKTAAYWELIEKT